LARIAAWLLSHDCATKTASKPNTTAKPTMTRVLARIALIPVYRRPIVFVVAVTIPAASIELVKSAALSFLSSTGFKPAFFTDRFSKCSQLNQFLIQPHQMLRSCRVFRADAKVFTTD
jgi:hypothetical protein